MTKKRKTKQLRWLVTGLMLAMTMVMPASTWAQVMYTVFNTETKTLTFKYGDRQSEESGDVYDVPTNDATLGWTAYNESIKTVVFDESFKNARPTSCCKWFYGFSNLTTIEGIENLNTEEVKNMSCMFYSCQKLTSLDVSKFNTDKVKNMSSMFQNCSGLTSLDLSSFNTAEVENMSCMFSNCSGLSSLDVSKFNTDKVTDMSGMLKGCKKLSSLDLSSFNTAKVMYMNDMFNYCSGLTSLDLSSFNTAEVTNMNDMFNYCSGLDNLDLSSFNTAKVTEMNYMFYGCSKLTTIYVGDGFTTGTGTNGSDMFSGCTSLEGNVSFNTNKTDHTMANYTSGYFTESNLTPYVKWDANTKVLTFKVANYIEGTQGEWKLNEGDTYPGWSGYEVTEYCTNVVFTPSFKQAKPTSCYMWFWGFGQLTTIEGIENLNTEEVTNMSGVFGGCSGLTSLDVSKFNTAKVENMSNMFNACSDLTSLDVSSFNTAKVTNMSCMFGNCTGLKSLDLSSFNTANVMRMDYMFPGCSGLTTIYVSDDFKIGNGTNGYDMFSNCTSLVGAAPYDSDKTDIEMANFDGYFTPKIITPYVKWDASTKVLTFKVANNKEAGSGVYDLNEGANALEWVGEVYSDCEKVVFTPSFKQARPTSCRQWFLGFSQLTTIEGIENLNTEEVTDMSEMFNSCSGLKNLDLSSFNTAKVKNMGYMFSGCYDLISLDLSSFNTAKVTDMTWMFYNCQSLTTIYASDGFTTGEVSSSDGMFESCFVLEGATPWDITKTGIDMANFDGYFTPKTITPYVKWDASTNELTFKVANNKEEGKGVYDLNESAKDPGWSIDDVKNNCTKVVFTSSFNHAKPTSCYKWFESFSNLTKIEGIENLNTEKVTDMSGMFRGCSGLTSLDLSSFNTAKVEKMGDMFRWCSGLTSLDLSSFNTANVKDMSGMFWGCLGLTSLDLSSFNTAKVEKMGYMFSDCSGLENLDLSSFNTAEVTDMHYMFPGCSGLTTIYVSDDFKIGYDTDGHEMFKDCTSLEGAASYSEDKTDKEMANYKTGYFKTYFTLGDSKVDLFGEQLTTNSLNLSGEKDFVAHAPFTANTATYSRDLSSSNSTWFSLCLPFAYSPNNFNFTAYKLNGATDDAVEIEEIMGTIVAGTPVLFKFKDGVVDVNKIINISATGADIVKAPVDGTPVTGDDGSSLQLCGTYQTKTFSSEDGNAFILLNDKLMNPAKMLENKKVTKVSVKPFRAYMTLTAPAQTSSARAFSIGHGGEEGTAAIDLLNSVATDDAEYYDINGRRIDAPVKGVNIVRRGNKTMKLIIK